VCLRCAEAVGACGARRGAARAFYREEAASVCARAPPAALEKPSRTHLASISRGDAAKAWRRRGVRGRASETSFA
jgi:hypothetical protein